jgi:hypothetical protein
MQEDCSVICDDTSNDADFMYCMGSFLKKSKERNGTCVPLYADLVKFYLK